MTRELKIDLDKVKELIESDWDDNMIRLKVGEYVLSVAEKQDSEIAKLLDIQFVRPMTIAQQPSAARCCRGRVFNA